jgi:hypothetical protein
MEKLAAAARIDRDGPDGEEATGWMSVGGDGQRSIEGK